MVLSKRHRNEFGRDAFAAELLMPYQQWLSAVPKHEPFLELIQRMADKFGTSSPAAASRVASLSNISCAFVAIQGGSVRYAACSTALRQAESWIPPRSVVPVGPVVNRVRSTENCAIEIGEVSQDFSFDNWEKALDLWELSRNYLGTDTTISPLWCDSNNLPKVNRFGARAEDAGGLAELNDEMPWPERSKRR